MPDRTNKGPAPFSLRLTAEERKLLDRKAAGQPLSRFIKSLIFHSDGNGDAGHLPGGQELAKVLGKLGQSGLSQNLAQLVEYVRLGAFPITPETEAQLRKTFADVQQMKAMLMAALRIKED